MLTANAQFETLARGPAPLGGDGDEIAHTVLVERDKRVLLENPGFQIVIHELAGVIARQAERGLGQVIGAKGEELAMLGDIHIAEPGAVIGFAGRRVIEQTVKETLPDGFQTAEYLLDHGMVDIVAPRTQVRPTIIRLISLLMGDKKNSEDTVGEGVTGEDLDIPESAEQPADKTAS